MKKCVALLGNLLLFSVLFWGVPAVEAQDVISTIPSDVTAYCHLKFPVMRGDTLSWQTPILDPLAGNVVDFYGPCDYDPVGIEEIRVQQRMLLRSDFDDGE